MLLNEHHKSNEAEAPCALVVLPVHVFVFGIANPVIESLNPVGVPKPDGKHMQM